MATLAELAESVAMEAMFAGLVAKVAIELAKEVAGLAREVAELAAKAVTK